ncbi:hypothetical protein M407DRAFT_141871 [Tulasnella calospora MUT 4182]|uniref:Uncharacterized protein n=1 Tax=Tulasnella calospora MUT 4182 TaxID=1051891 RepID=A0A0C3QR31_9AGAM|nr:hypothetical protein M407DRAFT_141871 [Tulasnella calospora MUT 4182]
MPIRARRQAPTALRLHRGPLPMSMEERHVLPQPPCPSLVAPTLRRRNTVRDLPHQPLLSLTIPASVASSASASPDSSSPTHLYSSTSASSSTSSLRLQVQPPLALTQMHFEESNTKKTVGPWDKSKSVFSSEGATEGGMRGWTPPPIITPPKAVVVSLPSLARC